MPEPDSFAARLRTARVSAGLTQEDLATRAKTTQRTISSWESGATEPNASNLRELCIALGVSSDYLVLLRHSPSGLDPDTWIIDIDAMEAAVPKSTWAVKVPRRLRVVEFEELRKLEADAMKKAGSNRRHKGGTDGTS